MYVRHVAHEVEREEVDPLHDVHRLFFVTLFFLQPVDELRSPLHDHALVLRYALVAHAAVPEPAPVIVVFTRHGEQSRDLSESYSLYIEQVCGDQHAGTKGDAASSTHILPSVFPQPRTHPPLL